VVAAAFTVRAKALVSEADPLARVAVVSLALCAAVWAQALPAVAVNFALALLFLPWPVPSQPFLFGLNGPYWSLSFELAANFVYGALARVRWALPVLVVVAGVGVGLTAVLYGNLDTGWQWTWPSAGAGLARSVFGVFLGVILYRNYGRVSGWVRWISPWAGFVLVGLVLASPGAGHLDPLADLAAVVLVFPAAVVAVSRHRSDRGRGFLLLLGAASYPLYAMHQQVGLLVQAVLGPLVDEAAPWSGLVLVTVLVALAAGLERFVDLPVRRWLRSRLAPRD
jgi:peptidoglycan/LPS O-acetylase OafA/YrhL